MHIDVAIAVYNAYSFDLITTPRKTSILYIYILYRHVIIFMHHAIITSPYGSFFVFGFLFFFNACLIDF